VEPLHNPSASGVELRTSAANITPGYTTWQQTAGYSDGDGGILLKPEMYTISLGLDWADTYRPQLEGVRRFLTGEMLRPTKIYSLGKTHPVWHLRLTIHIDLIKALNAMRPFLIKKKDQATAAIRYLNDEITGEQLVEEFNGAVRRGTRSGYIRHLRMPYTHSQGVAKGRQFLLLGPRRRWKAPPSLVEEVDSRKERGVTMSDICEKTGVSRSTIYRALETETSL
jgi:hypothetical protein